MMSMPGKPENTYGVSGARITSPEHENVKVQRLKAAMVLYQRCQPILSPAGMTASAPSELTKVVMPCSSGSTPLLFVHRLNIDVGCSLLYGLRIGKVSRAPEQLQTSPLRLSKLPQHQQIL